MSEPPRSHRPSALDGYRRIAPIAESSYSKNARSSRATVRRRPRMVGILRIVCAVGACAIVAGTSFALATAQPKHKNSTEFVTASSVSKSTEVSSKTQSKTPVKTKSKVKAVLPTVEPTVASVQKPASSTAELPFTGAGEDTLILMLSGASIILMGMLVQIAGTPLPKRSLSR